MFVENDFLKEGHAAQISSIVEFPHLGAWRNFESVAMQVVSTVLYRTGAKSPTAQQCVYLPLQLIVAPLHG